MSLEIPTCGLVLALMVAPGFAGPASAGNGPVASAAAGGVAGYRAEAEQAKGAERTAESAEPAGQVGQAQPAEQAEPERPLDRRDRERRAALAAAGLERRTVESEFGRLVYWIGGAGQPLVLLHGSGDSGGVWAVAAPELVGDHRLLVPDLAGYGESEPAEGVLPMATVFGGLEVVVEAAGLEPPLVMGGNSMGAWLAMLYAHRHPERVARVVAVNGGAILAEPSGLTLMPADREQARTVMAAIRDPSSPPLPDEVLDDIVERSREGAVARMMQDLPGMMGFLLDGKLGEIATPVDLLWGESDGLMKVSYAEKMAAALPRVRLTLVPRCGHIPMNECPETFVRLLREVLSSEPPAAAAPTAAEAGQ